jgi:hypothetical protein
VHSIDCFFPVFPLSLPSLHQCPLLRLLARLRSNPFQASSLGFDFIQLRNGILVSDEWREKVGLGPERQRLIREGIETGGKFGSVASDQGLLERSIVSDSSRGVVGAFATRGTKC